MIIRTLLATTLLALLLAAGCSTPQNLVVLIPDPDGQVGRVEVKNPQGAQVLDQAGQATFIQDAGVAPGAPQTMEQAEIGRRFGRAMRAQPDPPHTFLLYFLPNSAQLTQESAGAVSAIVEAIKERSSVDISVVGHADTMGSDAYNLKLSRERAQAVAQLLTQQGVKPAWLEITSHGKKRLLVPTGDNVSEPRNRRVEVVVR